MEDARDGVQGVWREDFESWRPGVESFFKAQENTEVRVLVLGPGPHSDSYPQRLAIIEGLRAANPANSVLTSEKLAELEPRFEELDEDDAEEVQANLADVLICLFVDDSKATGSRAEVMLFASQEYLREKLRVLKPAGEQPRGFLKRAVEKLRDDQCYDYSADEFEALITVSNSPILQACLQWVEAVRRAMHHAEWRALQVKRSERRID